LEEGFVDVSNPLKQRCQPFFIHIEGIRVTEKMPKTQVLLQHVGGGLGNDLIGDA
jgi:hypothetical protein